MYVYIPTRIITVSNYQTHHEPSRRAVGVLASDGTAIQSDAVVLAAACSTAGLARQAGVFAPVMPIKGYSITLPMQGVQPAPSTCVIDSAADSHVYATPLGQRLRVAGMTEIAGLDGSVAPHTVEYLRGYCQGPIGVMLMT
jgi:D-amino-acid dehydrogenase